MMRVALLLIAAAIVWLLPCDYSGGGDSQSLDSITGPVQFETDMTGQEAVWQTRGNDKEVVTLRNPSFEEMKTFLISDTTSRKPFVFNEYECRHFAAEVNNNAEAAGIRCAIVLICYQQGQHAVVAFETTDRGIIYIEPQTDAAVRPETGSIYQGMEIKEILTVW